MLSDHGNQFKADFDRTCQRLDIRHIRTRPRHCWTNGFVERLHVTILHEHWRVVFRRRSFTSRHQLQAFLDGFLDPSTTIADPIETTASTVPLLPSSSSEPWQYTDAHLSVRRVSTPFRWMTWWPHLPPSPAVARRRTTP